MKPWRLQHTAAAPFVLLCALVFETHRRWILTHFSSSPFLLDSGWFAHLFGAADPLLRNPSGVNDLSFYAHHLSPHIFLFGAPLVGMLGLTGFEIVAWHQALFFGLFFVACYVIAHRSGMRARDRFAAWTSAALIGALSNALLQAAAYPHYEIAMLAITTLAIGAWLARYRRMFVLCLIWLPLVREDGGFYAALACLACLALERDPGSALEPQPRRLMALALAGIGASLASFLIKAWFFPGFDAFAQNFSGHHWDHVSVPFLIQRGTAMLQNMNIVPVLVGCALLSSFDVRYATGLVLLSPLYLLHMLAVRPEHGHFTLYFAMPWLLPPLISLALFVRRARMSQTAFTESALVFATALALSAPLQAAVGVPGNSWYIAGSAFLRPPASVEGMQEFVRSERKSATAKADGRSPGESRQCVSQGIAALIPDEVRPDEVLPPDADVRGCQILYLMRGEMDYSTFRGQAEAAGLTAAASRLKAEVWRRTGAR